jgi:hypothetical protein
MEFSGTTGARLARPFDAGLKFCSRLDKPSPKCSGITSEHREFVGRRLIELPQVDTDVAHGRDRGISCREDPWIQVDWDTLSESIARSNSCNSHNRPTIRLIADRSQIRKVVPEQLLERAPIAALCHREPVPRPSPDEGERSARRPA